MRGKCEKILLIINLGLIINTHADTVWNLQIQNQTDYSAIIYAVDTHCFEAVNFNSISSPRAVLSNSASTLVVKENNSIIGHCTHSENKFLNFVINVDGDYQNKFTLAIRDKGSWQIPVVTYAKGTSKEHIYSTSQTYKPDTASVNVVILINPAKSAVISSINTQQL